MCTSEPALERECLDGENLVDLGMMNVGDGRACLTVGMRSLRVCLWATLDDDC